MDGLRMDIAELNAFIARVFPQSLQFKTQIEELTPGAIRVRLPFDDSYLRPGGTVSGPTLMTLADQAAFLLVLSQIGPVALAVTSSLTIHFLAKPSAQDVIADGRLLKLGKRLAVAEVHLRSDGDPRVVAHATVTYAIPQKA